jgi:hypothetical protein
MNRWVLFVSFLNSGFYQTADTKPWHFENQQQCEQMATTLPSYFAWKCELHFVENNGVYPVKP